MEDQYKIIREASRLAVVTFAAFITKESGVKLSDEQCGGLAERLMYMFYKQEPQTVKEMIDRYLDFVEEPDT